MEPAESGCFKETALRVLSRGWRLVWRRKGTATISEYDPVFRVVYLGNVPMEGKARGAGCAEEPLLRLWHDHVAGDGWDARDMKVTLRGAGLTAKARGRAAADFWASRITHCQAPAAYPRVFCWVYRHEGRNMRQKMLCHAVKCADEATARLIAYELRCRVAQAFREFRRHKVRRQNARLCLANAIYDNPSLPRREILLAVGPRNYRPPIRASKSAPDLSTIEEEEDESGQQTRPPRRAKSRRASIHDAYKDAETSFFWL